jgi:hypothetical protein
MEHRVSWGKSGTGAVAEPRVPWDMSGPEVASEVRGTASACRQPIKQKPQNQGLCALNRAKGAKQSLGS